MGHNMVPLLEDHEMTLGTGSFTAFVGVCRNDQLHKGCGSTSVLPGAHHLSEQFVRVQRDANSHLAPQGPGWPRKSHDVPNCCLVAIALAAADRVRANALPDLRDGDALAARLQHVDEGQVRETGSHDELMRNTGGPDRRFAELQP